MTSNSVCSGYDLFTAEGYKIDVKDSFPITASDYDAALESGSHNSTAVDFKVFVKGALREFRFEQQPHTFAALLKVTVGNLRRLALSDAELLGLQSHRRDAAMWTHLAVQTWTAVLSAAPSRGDARALVAVSLEGGLRDLCTHTANP